MEDHSRYDTREMSDGEALFYEAEEGYDRDDYDPSLVLYAKSIELLEKEGNMALVARALLQSASCHYFLDRFQLAFEFALKADKLQIKLFGEKSLKRCEFLEEIISCAGELEMYKTVKKYALVFRDIARASGDNDLVVRSILCLAHNYFDADDFKSVLVQCDEGLALVKPEDSSSFLDLLLLAQRCWTELKVSLFLFFFLCVEVSA